MGASISSIYKTFNAEQLINELGSVASAMGTNPAYKGGQAPHGAGTASQLLELRERLIRANEESKTHDVNKIAARKLLEQEAIVLLDSVRRYMQFAAVANPEVLRDTGFSQRAPTKRNLVLGAPTCSVVPGPVPGSLAATAILSAKSVAIEIHVAQGDPNHEPNWRLNSLQFDPQSMLLLGFVPGNEYALRFRGINDSGPGAWSAPISVLVK